MIRVIHIPNAFEPHKRNVTPNVSNITEHLAKMWPRIPNFVAIYHNEIAMATNVTPTDLAGIDRLEKLEGDVYVVEHPQGAVVAAYAIIGILLAVAIYASIPKAPDAVAIRNQSQSSSNNDLSSRTNRARPNGRIPDIFGEHISIPDLIAQPYSIYVDNEEYEYSYMCVGRGDYDINEDDIKDDTTPVNKIFGASLRVFGPNTSPNSGSPQITIGDAITEPVLYVDRTEAVNGQILKPKNADAIVQPRVSAHPSGSFVRDPAYGGSAFTDTFDIGDFVTFSGAPFQFFDGGSTVGFFDLNGIYQVSAVSATVLTLTSPASVNGNWNVIQDPAYSDPSCAPVSGEFTLGEIQSEWVGPVIALLPDMDNIIINVKARGLYKDDGTTQYAADVKLEFEITPTDSLGNPSGATILRKTTFHGSATEQAERGLTIRLPTDLPAGTNGVSVRARRTTLRDTGFTGTVVDEVQWKDLYGVARVADPHFGNVTTVQSLSRATRAALSLKERKLNMKVVRRVYRLESTGPGNHTLDDYVGTKDIASIIAAVCLDPKIGNYAEADIDFYSLRSQVDAAVAYFGKPHVGEFGYTFDSDNTSFEEIISTIADAAFCTAYREGSVIKLFCEKSTEESSLLFCHRNKLPRTEKRTHLFGSNGKYDGIEYTYVDQRDSAPLTIYVPDDRTAINAQKVESVGVRTYYQAYLHAHRLYNKQTYRRMTVEFTATQEADLLVRNERIIVSNNTRPRANDGEITAKDGLVLTTSQPVYFTPAVEHSVFLQLKDGSVQSIVATQGDDEYSIVLAEEPDLDLTLDQANFAVCYYTLVPADQRTPIAFLVNEKAYEGPFTYKVTAVNYDERYYQDDKTFAFRLFIPMEDAATDDYDDATPEERAAGGYLCEDDGKIPTANDDGYMLAEDDEA